MQNVVLYYSCQDMCTNDVSQSRKRFWMMICCFLLSPQNRFWILPRTTTDGSWSRAASHVSFILYLYINHAFTGGGALCSHWDTTWSHRQPHPSRTRQRTIQGFQLAPTGWQGLIHMEEFMCQIWGASVQQIVNGHLEERHRERTLTKVKLPTMSPRVWGRDDIELLAWEYVLTYLSFLRDDDFKEWHMAERWIRLVQESENIVDGRGSDTHILMVPQQTWHEDGCRTRDGGIGYQ